MASVHPINEEIVEVIPKFDPKKCLPPELVVESVDDILYRIGLCFTSVRDRPKRHIIDHPFIAFIISSIFLIERLITVLLSDRYDRIFIVLGDTGYFIGLRREIGPVFI